MSQSIVGLENVQPYKFSECSRSDYIDALRIGHGLCLLNKPNEVRERKLVQAKEEKRLTLFETHFKGISNPNFESFEHSLKSDEIAETGSSKMAKSATVDLLMTVARRIHAVIQLRVSLSKKLNALRVRAVTTAK